MPETGELRVITYVKGKNQTVFKQSQRWNGKNWVFTGKVEKVKAEPPPEPPAPKQEPKAEPPAPKQEPKAEPPAPKQEPKDDGWEIGI